MHYFKNFILQVLICAFSFFIVLVIPLVLLDSSSFRPAHLEHRSFLLWGLLLSYAFYGIGRMLRDGFLNSPDSQLFPLTPLTPRRLYLQALKHQAGFVLGFLILFPALLLFIAYGPLRRQSNLHPLAGLNLALTVLVLMLYPFHLSMSARPWAWNFFFCARRLLLHALMLLVGFPVQLFKRFALLWFLGLGALLFFGHHELLAAWERLQVALVGQGTWGLGVVYCFLPVTGLIYMCLSEVPPQAHAMLTAVLCTLLIFCLRSLHRMFNLPVTDIENAQVEWRTENRDEVEELEEQAMAEADAAIPRPWEGNSLQEGFTSAESAALSNANQEVTGAGLPGPATPPDDAAEPAPPTPFPQDSCLAYQTSMPGIAQIRRHAYYWYPVRSLLITNPWIHASGLVLACTAWATGWVHSPSPSRLAFLALVFAAIPILQLVHTSSALGVFSDWAAVVPLRWPRLILSHAVSFSRPRLILSHAVSFSRPRLGMELGVILVAYVIAGCHPVLLAGFLVLLPLQGILNRIFFGLLYWFHARSQVGGNRATHRFLGLAYLVLWLFTNIGLACNADGLPANCPSVEPVIGAIVLLTIVWTSVLLLIGVVAVLLMRLKADTQVMAMPGLRLIR